MSIFRGEKISLEVFGKSHSEKIGMILKGVPKDFDIDLDKIQQFMARRQAKKSAFSTSRIEEDKPIFQSGLNGNKTDGEEILAYIENKNVKSGDYKNLDFIPRPSHADFSAFCKFGENFDFRGGGQFSGRLTAPICVAGGIAKQILEKEGIEICAYISSIGKICGESYKNQKIESDMIDISKGDFPALSQSSKEKFMAEITKVKAEGDSVGGVVECVVKTPPVGLSDVMFYSLESKISALMFGVPAVKGIEFGSGFDIAQMYGSEANDVMFYEDEVVKFKSNHNGGITGGITNGNEISLAVAFKPTPSIALPQQSIDMKNKTNVELVIKGRHDSCIVVRAVPVVEACVALAILDCII